MIKENYILQWYNLVRLNNKKATFTSWIISEMCSVPVWPTNLGSSEIQIYYKLTSFASTLIMRNKSSRTQKVPNSLRLPWNMVLHFQETLHSTEGKECARRPLSTTRQAPQRQNPSREGRVSPMVRLQASTHIIWEPARMQSIRPHPRPT